MDDFYGNGVTTASRAAVRHYDRAVDAHLHAWPGALESVEMAIAEDPDFALPHSLKALVLAVRGRGPEAREAIATGRSCAVRAMPREQSHVELISAIVEGRARDALARVVEHASQYPTDVLAASAALGAYGLFAFSGRLAIRWARALIALLDGDRAAAREHLDACSDEAVRLGGSHAQRGIVDQTRDAMRLPSFAG